MRSRLEPMKKFVRTLRNHEELLMNYFKAGKGYSSGIVEGLNLNPSLTPLDADPSNDRHSGR